jgi:hypothetical protein
MPASTTDVIGVQTINALRQLADQLKEGALVNVDPLRARAIAASKVVLRRPSRLLSAATASLIISLATWSASMTRSSSGRPVWLSMARCTQMPTLQHRFGPLLSARSDYLTRTPHRDCRNSTTPLFEIA